MDSQLDNRLQAIQEAAEAAAVNAGAEPDILPIRNEIEDMESRLAEFIGGNFDTVMDRLASNREALQRIQGRVDELADTVAAIQAELPAE